jgi:hypothetical protein
MVVFVAAAIPLLLAEGLDGLAIGMAATGATGLVLRWWYVRRLFPGEPLGRLVGVAAVPAALGALAVLAAEAPALAEAALYVVVVGGATVALQGGLFREALGYLARRAPAQTEPATRAA